MRLEVRVKVVCCSWLENVGGLKGGGWNKVLREAMRSCVWGAGEGVDSLMFRVGLAKPWER